MKRIFFCLACMVLVTFISQHLRALKVEGGGSSALGEPAAELALSFSAYRGDSVELVYDSVGSGTGKTNLLSYTYDYAFSDSIWTDDQYAQFSDLQQLPLAAQPICIVFNLPGVSKLQVKQKDLANIFLGNITYWSEVDANLPNQKIKRIVRAKKSGTTEILVDALASFEPEWDNWVGGTHSFPDWLHQSDSDRFQRAEGTSNLARAVLSTQYSIGYISLPAQVQFGAEMAHIENRRGEFILPTPDSVQSSQSSAEFNERFAASLSNLDGSGVYPISGYGYAMARKTSPKDCDVALEVFRYYYWLFSHTDADKILLAQNTIPLPQSIKDRIVTMLKEEFYCDGKLLYPQTLSDYTALIVGTSIGGAAIIVCWCCFMVCLCCILVSLVVLLCWTRKRLKREIHGLKQVKVGPEGYIAMAFTDIEGSTSLWESSFQSMQYSMSLHDAVLRDAIKEHNGYEVKTEGDAFMVAFQDPVDALKWATTVQNRLLTSDWPEPHDFGATALPQFETVKDGSDDYIFNGLRVRIGIHAGEALMKIDDTTNRSDYFGPTINCASRISDMAHGGQTVVSNELWEYLMEQEVKREDFSLAKFVKKKFGTFTLRGIPQPVTIHTVLPYSLQGRLKYFTKPRVKKTQNTHFTQSRDKSPSNHQSPRTSHLSPISSPIHSPISPRMQQQTRKSHSTADKFVIDETQSAQSITSKERDSVMDDQSIEPPHELTEKLKKHLEDLQTGGPADDHQGSTKKPSSTKVQEFTDLSNLPADQQS